MGCICSHTHLLALSSEKNPLSVPHFIAEQTEAPKGRQVVGPGLERLPRVF